MKGKYGTAMTTFRAPKLDKICCNCKNCMNGKLEYGQVHCYMRGLYPAEEKFCKYYYNVHSIPSNNNNRKKTNKKSKKKYYKKNHNNKSSK